MPSSSKGKPRVEKPVGKVTRGTNMGKSTRGVMGMVVEQDGRQESRKERAEPRRWNVTRETTNNQYAQYIHYYNTSHQANVSARFKYGGFPQFPAQKDPQKKFRQPSLLGINRE